MDAREFSKFSFVSMKGPGSLGLAVLIILLGLAAALSAGSILEGRLAIDPWVFAAGFILLNLASAQVVTAFARGFKAKWAYFAVLINQAALVGLTALFTLSHRVTLFDTLVLWTALSYSVWMLVLSGLGAVRIGIKAVLLSFVQAVLNWAWLLVSLKALPGDPTAPLVIMFSGIVVSTLIIWFTEHIFSLVFAGMSGLAELSKFLKGIRGEQASLAIGHNIDALVQCMMFRAKGKEHVILAPWLHSGPIRSVGGGNLSTQCIEKLNQKYGDSYLLHVPSTHEYNPSGKIAARVVGSIGEGPYAPLKISDVVMAEEDGIMVFGQRFNDTYLVSVSSRRIDDYDISIFHSLREKHRDKKVLFIDSHPNFPLEAALNVEAFTKEADIVSQLADQVIAKLSDVELYPAEVGTGISAIDQYTIFALAMKAKKTYLYFVADTNGLSVTEVKSLESIARKAGVDRALFFTTDTHSLSIKALISRPDMPVAEVRRIVDKALKDVAPAEFAYSESLLKNVRIFGKTYYELVTLVKIMSRVIPVLFALLFIFLVVILWIF